MSAEHEVPSSRESPSGSGIEGRKADHIRINLDEDVGFDRLTVGFEKVETPVLASWLLTKHHIHVTSAVRAGIDGIRISPNVFTTFEETDRLGKILADVANNGI